MRTTYVFMTISVICQRKQQCKCNEFWQATHICQLSKDEKNNIMIGHFLFYFIYFFSAHLSVEVGRGKTSTDEKEMWIGRMNSINNHSLTSNPKWNSNQKTVQECVRNDEGKSSPIWMSISFERKRNKQKKKNLIIEKLCSILCFHSFCSPRIRIKVLAKIPFKLYTTYY